jgi:hypothetical protein
MKWLLVVVAFILGAAITSFLTVKRGTRVVSAGGQVNVGDDSSADVEDVADDASAFGGAHTSTSEVAGAAEAWDREAEDEDALMAGRSDDAAELPVPPVAEATPNGDMAGVGDPDEVAAIDEQIEQHTETPDTP